MSETPEFSRLVRLDTLGEGLRSIAIAAETAERAALAARFGLVTIDRLEADAHCRRQGEEIAVEGQLRARVVQSCVVSDEPLPVTIDEAFALRFVPAEHLAAEGEEEVELDAEACDIVPYEGSAIDLGEAVAETLALTLDPFPRAADADERLRQAGILSEEAAGPFSALKGLREKLSGKAD